MLQMVLMSSRQDCYVIKVNKEKLVLLSHKSYVHGPLKVAPAFMSPKGILEYMKVPQGVVKAVFS